MSVRHRQRLPALRVAAALPLALAATGAAHAQTHLTPGLWESQVTMKSDNAQMDSAMAKMKEQLASMPPDKRAMVEQMMASRGMGAGGTANSFRICMTKEQAERDSVPQHDANCSQQDVTRSGNTMKYKFTCESRQGHPVSGAGEFTVNGPTAYTGHTVTTMTVQGKPTQMTADVTGKWLGADCGDVKPLQPHPAH
jgi:hypothetical protein